MKQPLALIIDDEPDIRELLEITLGRMGINTQCAENVATATQLINEQKFDLCLTDMKLPDGDGLELVQLVQNTSPETPIAVITAFGSMDIAIRALKVGAFDFLSKPVDLKRLRELVNSALKLSTLEESISDNDSSRLLLGESAAMEKLRSQITKISRSQAPVYISGESGSGKELVAKTIHQLGPRKSENFIPVNCGAIPKELMESEFFGHKKGSFTGAVEDKTGLFEAAHGGTLFLDEVADLPLDMQVKLLRAIQEKAIRAVGAHSEIEVDVRVLSATHKNLAQLVEKGEFRQDLFYRLNVIELKVPSLKERKEDLDTLITHILNKLTGNSDKAQTNLAKDAKEALTQYNFPGNVRELENILERAVTLCEDNTITAEDLRLDSEIPNKITQHITAPTAEPTTKPEEPANLQNTIQANLANDLGFELPKEISDLEGFLESIEKAVIERTLFETRWNKTAAAKKLGISFRTMRYRLKKLGLD